MLQRALHTLLHLPHLPVPWLLVRTPELSRKAVTQPPSSTFDGPDLRQQVASLARALCQNLCWLPSSLHLPLIWNFLKLQHVTRHQEPMENNISQAVTLCLTLILLPHELTVTNKRTSAKRADPCLSLSTTPLVGRTRGKANPRHSSDSHSNRKDGAKAVTEILQVLCYYKTTKTRFNIAKDELFLNSFLLARNVEVFSGRLGQHRGQSGFLSHLTSGQTATQSREHAEWRHSAVLTCSP